MSSQPYHAAFTGAALLLSASLSVLAGSLSAAAPAPLPPLKFDQGRGTFEIIERLRFEDRADNFDFDSSAHSPTDDSWWVQRLRLGATWKPAPLWTLQAQVQDAREWGAERPNVPFILGAEGDDPLDVRLASVTWGDPKTTPVVVTLGRQVLSLGEERLVGASEWGNFARTFDAAKVVWAVRPNQMTATVWISSVVTVQPTAEGESWRFNRSSADDLFSGAYLSNKLGARDTFDVYALWRNKRKNDPIYRAPNAAIPAGARTAAAYDIAQDVYTFGTRFVRAPKAGAFDAEFEAAWQGGRVDRQTTSAAVGVYGGSDARLDHGAWAVHTLVGYSPDGAPGKLRFNAEYNVASGDTHRSDDRNGSFMVMFPGNHPFYGFMDMFAWKNLEEWVATVRFSPLPNTTLRVDYHDLSLYTTSDAWYRANGVSTVRPVNDAARSGGRSAGREVDLLATWTPAPWLRLDLGWSWFKSGSYLEATGAHSDARFLYVQTTLKY